VPQARQSKKYWHAFSGMISIETAPQDGHVS
jgi:hypothetical protein